MLALIAGQGALPGEVLDSQPTRPIVCALEGFPPDLPGGPEITFRIEKLGALIADLKARGVTDLCLAGAIARPAIDARKIGLSTLPLVPRMMQAIREGGDDAALRTVIAIFEDAGFTLRGAHELTPDLLPPAGVLAGRKTADIAEMADRGAEVLDGLSALDLGQSCVVRGSRVVAVEAAPGTDWMLGSLTGGEAAGGSMIKAPKAGQDRRVDLPAIGPGTIQGAARAGLSAVVIQAGGVMVLNRADTIAAAQETGITLWVR